MSAAALAALRAADWADAPAALARFLAAGGSFDELDTEGYWYADNPEARGYPLPEAGSWTREEADAFLPLLDRVQASLAERGLAIKFMGVAPCRVCGGPNGCAEYYAQGWRWPEGLRHYLDAHLVRPSPEFAEFIASTAARVAARPDDKPRLRSRKW